MDQFIQLHTVMIKGIAQDISPESAERGIGRIFSRRFGCKNVLKIQVFRPIENIRKLIKDRKIHKKKLNKAKRHNHHHSSRQSIVIGAALSCRKQSVDAEGHFQERIKAIDQEIGELQARSKKANLGIAFISFKERDCATETLDEMELVKQNLTEDKKASELGVANWKVERACPPSDIIWSEI